MIRLLTRWGTWLCVLVAWFWCATPVCAATQLDNSWYVVLIEDQRVGWMHLHTDTTDPNEVQSTAETQITVRRGSLDMRIHIRTHFRETRNGRPIFARVDQTLGRMSTTQSMTFGEDTVQVVSQQQGHESKQTLPIPRVQRDPVPGAWAGGWLPPAAAQRYVEQRMAAGDNDIKIWTLDPSMGTDPIHVWMSRGDRQTVDVYGRTIAATVWDSTMSVMPGVVNREYIDSRGRMVKSTLDMIPGMSFTIMAADKQLALSDVDPPELMVGTLVTPDRGIDHPRGVTAAGYKITLKRDRSLVPKPPANITTQPMTLSQIPNTASQSVTALAPDTVRIQVQVVDDETNHVDPAPDARYLAPSTVLAADDSAVLNHVTKALRDLDPSASDVHRAELLRRYVQQYITSKDLSVGFATASEVARTAQGDCTEHAVLLAAMLRAARIPSRTVSGLIYVDHFLGRQGVFGYHMWAQAWLPAEGSDDPAAGRWVDLDATLQDAPFDATHIVLATSLMSDDAVMNDMVRLVPLIGRLEIQVLDVTHDQTANKVPSP